MEALVRPLDECIRLEALRRYKILDTPAEPAFDEIATLVAHLCEAPICLISLLDEEREWFKARIGLSFSEIHRDVSFGRYTLLQRDAFIVPDALKDERFFNSPLVTGKLRVRFYAGVPLITSEGLVLGTLSVMDRVPRELNAVQQETMRVLSRLVMSQFEIRRQARELHEKETMVENAQSRALLGSWEMELATQKGAWSLEQLKLLGCDPALGAPSFQEFLEHIHPEDRAAAQAVQVRLLESDVLPAFYEFRTNPTLGPVRHLSATFCVIRDTTGRAVRIAGTTLDITERKVAEEQIQRLNRVYSVLSEVNQIIVREKDTQTMLDTACRIIVEKGGFCLTWIGLFDPLSIQYQLAAQAGRFGEYHERINGILAEGPLGNGPTGLVLRNGVHVISNDIASDPSMEPWREEALRLGFRSLAAFPIKAKGKTVGAFNLYASTADFFDEKELRLLDKLAIDISFALEVGEQEQRRRKVEEELRWKTAFFEAQVDSALDGIIVVDSQGKKIIQNQRNNELWKIPAHIAENPDDSVQVHYVTNKTKNPEAFFEKVAYLYSHPNEKSRDVIELTDGTILDRFSSPVLDKNGKNYGRIWTFRDITEQRQLEEKFRQSQKMEAVGQLAGGVAHDFNNILAAIMMQTSLAAGVENVPAEAREILNDITATTERGANLTRQLLAFSRRQVMQTRILDLNVIVTSLAKMLQRILGEDVRLQLNLSPRPLIIRADAGMLDQVLLNLVVNARDAMPGGGRLIIETKAEASTEAAVAASPDSASGLNACLSVTDTGCGISPENKVRIFDPFFTTKAPGKGTGLGLATVFGIVKQHDGAIDVESEVGKGSSFRIYLPIDEEANESPDVIEAKPHPRGGTETILLVEDDSSVRILTRAVFERAGYKVIEATDGIEALQLSELHRHEIRLLFTDVVMPGGINGREVAARMQERNPNLRVVFSSGYAADITGRELILDEAQAFIQKPASPEELLEVVRRSLDE